MRNRNACTAIARTLTGFFIVAGLCAGMAHSASTELPPNPGYYHFNVGAYQVTALSDGTVQLPATKILHAPPEQIRAALHQWFMDSPVETSVNAYLIDTGERQILVDAGGKRASLNRLLDNLRSAGYVPRAVDAVLLTHMHPDHVGGLLDDGQRSFPNATVYVARAEASYWLDRRPTQQGPQAGKQVAKTARKAIEPYAEAGALRRFEGATELFPGIHARPAHGHTPGHTIYRVESKGETLVLWGDLIHVAAVQFDDPGVAIDYDFNPEQAIESRRAAFARAAKHGWLVAGAHLPFPGVGHIRKDDNGYAWYPINYSPH